MFLRIKPTPEVRTVIIRRTRQIHKKNPSTFWKFSLVQRKAVHPHCAIILLKKMNYLLTHSDGINVIIPNHRASWRNIGVARQKNQF